uniref:PBZ-type domain-containing protein n=1 Tax=Oryzias latipes TaxID=8090 RepID=A0A3P9JTT9_ORYLA
LMSGFLLVPVDGGNPVPVPPGETLLGRGPLLRISDKRVSRRHGLLQILDGELRLKPTHANPCFIQASLSSEPRPLPRGSWYTLRDGELLSLLPGRLLFRVEAVGGEECTSRYSRSVWAAASSAPLLFEAGIKQTEEDPPVDEELLLQELPHVLVCLPVRQLQNQHSFVFWSLGPPGTLRFWTLMEARFCLQDVPAGASAVPWRKPTRPHVENAPHRLAVNADDPGGPPTNRTQEDRDTSVLAPPRATPTTQRRMPCPYGKDCYRKNPLHFQESSHPGDSDYEEEEEEEGGGEEEERPEYPIPAEPTALQTLPARSTRAVPRNPPDEEEDEDSFIDDDSEDPDNDSDYNPAPSDDSDGEDIKRLQREATGFLKRRK